MKGVHLARWVLLEPTVTPYSNEPIPSELVFRSVYDESLERHLDELVQHGRAAIDALYAQCEGYPTREGLADSARKAFLLNLSLPPSAVYGAHDGLSLRQILLEDRLRQFLRDTTDAKRANWMACISCRGARRGDLGALRLACGERALSRVHLSSAPGGSGCGTRSEKGPSSVSGRNVRPLARSTTIG